MRQILFSLVLAAVAYAQNSTVKPTVTTTVSASTLKIEVTYPLTNNTTQPGCDVDCDQRFCLCLVANDLLNVTMAVVNKEEPVGLSAEYLSFVNKDLIQQKPYDSIESARQAVADGKAVAAIHFPVNYTATLNQKRLLINEDKLVDKNTKEGSSIKLYLDMSNQAIALKVLEALHDALILYCQDYLSLLGYSPGPGMTFPLNIDKVIYTNYRPIFAITMALDYENADQE